jgi:hypothetical protein
MAWHREWAFVSDDADILHRRLAKFDPHPTQVHYKGQHVGDVDQGNVILFNQYAYLTEAFVEAMIHAS